MLSAWLFTLRAPLASAMDFEKVWIGRLPYWVTKDDLTNGLAKLDIDVRNVFLAPRRDGGQNLSAIVDFGSVQGAAGAIFTIQSEGIPGVKTGHGLLANYALAKHVATHVAPRNAGTYADPRS